MSRRSPPFGAVESYKFQIFDVVPQSFNIGLGQVVTNGVPAVGAGNIETPGALDIYTITVYGVEDGTGTYQFQIRNPP